MADESLQPAAGERPRTAVLLVEDDPHAGAAMATMLRRRGFAVALEGTAEGALRRLQREAFDAVLADIRLPGASGVDLLRAVREKDRHFPVVLITGYDSMESARQAIRLGANDYVLKPLTGIDDIAGPIERSVTGYRVLMQNRRLERELAESEARLRDVTDNSFDVLFRYDIASKRFDVVSPAAARLLGHPADFMQNLTWQRLLEMAHPKDIAGLQEAARSLRLMTREGAAAHAVAGPALSLRLRHREGSFRWFSVTCRPTGYAGDRPTRIVGVARDVTAERDRQEQESLLRERLERAERMQSLGHLAGGVAHELNNVLTPILGMPELVLEALEEEPPNRADMRDMLEMIRSAAGQAKEIVRNLLTLSRRGGFQAVPVPVDAMLRDFLASGACRACVQANPEATFTVEIPDGLGAVAGSAPHLVQLLTNLVMNAFEAIGPRGHVHLQATRVGLAEAHSGYENVPPGQYVLITVEDDGSGIEISDIEHIFEPFFSRKQNTARSGTGLGLAVVYGVVRDHHGYLDVRTALGEGTCFSIYLPTADIEANAAPRAAVPHGSRERILVVDDQPTQRELACRMLRQLGYEVSTAVRGQDAVAVFAEHAKASTGKAGGRRAFDLVLLDMIMEPGFDGLDAYRGIIALSPRQPCIIVSGYSETGRVREALRLGVGNFLQKPYTYGELAQVVRDELMRAARISGGDGEAPAGANRGDGET